YLDERIKRVVVVHNTTREELDLPRGNQQFWDAAVAVGPGVKDELVKRWDEKRVRMIPVGVRNPNIQARRDFHRSELQICYVGRLAQGQKNVLLIPRIAAALLRRGVAFRWLIVGDGPDR